MQRKHPIKFRREKIESSECSTLVSGPSYQQRTIIGSEKDALSYMEENFFKINAYKSEHSHLLYH